MGSSPCGHDRGLLSACLLLFHRDRGVVSATRFRRLIAAGALLVAPLAVLRSAEAVALSCTEAAAIAEADSAVPAGLLLAIGIVESGRTDALKNRSPWPWTINTGGAGRFLDTAEAAILAVQGLRASGLRSIDIGCFQINLAHHPDAFPDLASGFDPLKNAQAAARFLVSLREEFGAWEPAVAAYHSRTEAEGVPYRDRVLAAWHGTPFSGGTTVAGFQFADSHIVGVHGGAIHVSGAQVAGVQVAGVQVAGVQVWGPGGELGAHVNLPVDPTLMMTRRWRRRLPHVVTVSMR